MSCPCPFVHCTKKLTAHRFLQTHWDNVHSDAGPLGLYTAKPTSDASSSTKHMNPTAEGFSSQGSSSQGSSSQQNSSSRLLDAAMSHVDTMKFRYGTTDAQAQRAKDMASACLEAIKPDIAQALRAHVHSGVEVQALVDPLLGVFDKINSRWGESRERTRRSDHPPLRCYPRSLGIRPALQGKRKCIDGVEAFAWDTCFEEVMEREIFYDPQLLTQLIVSDLQWKERAKQLSTSDRRDPNRVFEDQCDGEVWQDHEVLGDPNYVGPTRLAGKGYCDDVDVPNGIGPAAGHSKLYIQTFTLVNRPPRSRQTMRAQFLGTVCLSSDFKTFGAHSVISGQGATEFSLGATCRRCWTNGVIRLPVGSSLPTMDFRLFLTVWAADGMAMGDVVGTNTSFSSCVNPCSSCEDFDQRSRASRTPCGFLRCHCGDANKHRRGCPCHFRLRTPARDKLLPTNPSKAQMQSLGRTTLTAGLSDVPGVHLSTVGPKDVMHTLNEGRTSQLAAVTLWNIVASGWATKEEVRRRASVFDWTPGGGSGFYCPNYLPEKIFVSTKVAQPDGSWVWGPHKDIKIPGSAVGVTTYTIMSTEFLRPFIPEGPHPDWFRAWQLHRVAFCMTLRFRFLYSDLLVMEDHFVESETLIVSIPEYQALYIPKAHWVLHIAHDIFQHGPSRLLATLLNEMKNAQFKRGASRSNYHNPAKSAGEFWARSSDYDLQNSTASGACCSKDAPVLVTGSAERFPDSLAVRLLIEHSCINSSTIVEFLTLVKVHAVPLRRADLILLDQKVYSVQRIIRVSSSTAHFVLLYEMASCLSVDTLGAFYVQHAEVTDALPQRLVSLSHSLITCLWTVPNGNRLYLVPKV